MFLETTEYLFLHSIFPDTSKLKGEDFYLFSVKFNFFASNILLKRSTLRNRKRLSSLKYFLTSQSVCQLPFLSSLFIVIVWDYGKLPFCQHIVIGEVTTEGKILYDLLLNLHSNCTHNSLKRPYERAYHVRV